jgi:hypothetical protein
MSSPVWLQDSLHGVAVRALLWLEVGGPNKNEACPWCGVTRSHSATCGLTAALVRHGLSSRDERDAARKAIEGFRWA